MNCFFKIAADRASSENPIRMVHLYDGSLSGLYPIGMGNTYSDSVVEPAHSGTWAEVAATAASSNAGAGTGGTGNRTVTSPGAAKLRPSGFEEMITRLRLARKMLHAGKRGGVRQFCCWSLLTRQCATLL